MSIIASLPRFFGVLLPCVALAVYRLFLLDTYYAGPKGLALVLAVSLLALPTYVVATGIAVVRRLLARWMAWAGRGLDPSAAVVCFVLGVMSRQGNLERLWLGLALGVFALVTENVLARVVAPGWVARHRRAWNVVALVVISVVLVVVPVRILTGTASFYDIDLTEMSKAGGKRQNVVVIGVDGMDWRVTNELMARGELPNLQRLAEQGVWRELHTMVPTYSPLLWNTIYTGFDPAVHRLRPAAFAPHFDMLLRERDEGRFPDPLSRLLAVGGAPTVRYPFALWDLFEAAGYTVGVAGAFEDEPAPETGRFFAGFEVRYLPTWDPSARLDLANDPSLWVAPDLRDEVAALDRAPAEIPAGEWEALVGPGVTVKELLAAGDAEPAPPEEQRLSRVRSLYPSDRFRMELMRLGLRSFPEPYFLFGYFRGVDMMQHAYWHRHAGAEVSAADTVGSAGGAEPDVITRYHRVVDGWIGEIWTAIGEDGVMVVISDHGINLDESREHPYWTGFHDFGPSGVFLSNARREVASDGDEPLRDGEAAHIFDVAPTVLALVGMPVLATMEGRTIEDVADRPLMVVDWWGLRPAAFEDADKWLQNPELRKLLKSLGYL